MTRYGTAWPELHPVFVKQLDALARHDLDALMEVYHPDAEWVRFQGVAKGHEAIRALIARDWERGLDFVGMHEYIHTDDTIMARCVMAVGGEKVVASGSFVLRDGMIWRVTGADTEHAGEVRAVGRAEPAESRPYERRMPALDHTAAGLLATLPGTVARLGRRHQYERELGWLSGS
ncbi:MULTISPECIES: nuclear transport factor 2 family protein [unclassified Streptomyces]|uniref:nuclear transport factor 2 family protein n=1 Tax=unclassified Streptomyces TaxID=2593676 RepID=UPI002E297B31|nr:nuclear transport factor 2 family protein [Streptomyces sp. NBC_00441]